MSLNGRQFSPFDEDPATRGEYSHILNKFNAKPSQNVHLNPTREITSDDPLRPPKGQGFEVADGIIHHDGQRLADVPHKATAVHSAEIPLDNGWSVNVIAPTRRSMMEDQRPDFMDGHAKVSASAGAPWKIDRSIDHPAQHPERAVMHPDELRAYVDEVRALPNLHKGASAPDTIPDDWGVDHLDGRGRLPKGF